MLECKNYASESSDNKGWYLNPDDPRGQPSAGAGRPLSRRPLQVIYDTLRPKRPPKPLIAPLKKSNGSYFSSTIKQLEKNAYKYNNNAYPNTERITLRANANKYDNGNCASMIIRIFLQPVCKQMCLPWGYKYTSCYFDF